MLGKKGYFYALDRKIATKAQNLRISSLANIYVIPRVNTAVVLLVMDT